MSEQRAVNVTLDGGLLDEAGTLQLDLSSELNTALHQLVKKHRHRLVLRDEKIDSFMPPPLIEPLRLF